MKTCGARLFKGVFVGCHTCTRIKNHKGKHRCYKPSEGKIFIKARKKVSPCGKRW